MLSHFSHVQLFVTLWTVALQAPLSLGCSRQEYWSGLPRPPPGDLPDPGIKPASLMSPILAGGLFTTSATWVSRMNLANSFHWMQKRWKRAGTAWLACPGLSAGGARDSAWCFCGPAVQELVWAANGGWGLSTTHPLCFKDKQLRASESQTSGLFQFVGLHCNSGTFLEA